MNRKRVLFDENLPKPLRRSLSDHEIRRAQELGYSGVKNGRLLDAAEHEFDVFLTADKNMRFQQNLSGRRLAIIELPTNRWPFPPALIERISSAPAGDQAGRVCHHRGYPVESGLSKNGAI